jgi:hypothetical protein
VEYALGDSRQCLPRASCDERDQRALVVGIERAGSGSSRSTCDSMA